MVMRKGALRFPSDRQ